jgi:hypothetical protein
MSPRLAQLNMRLPPSRTRHSASTVQRAVSRIQPASATVLAGRGVATAPDGLLRNLASRSAPAPLPLNRKYDFARHTIGDDPVVLHHTFRFIDTEQHNTTQGFRCLGNRYTARIVKAEL